MSVFRFRLDAVRRLYETQRDSARQNLAEAFQAQHLLNERTDRVEDELSELKNAARQRSTSGTVDIDWILQTKRYEQVLLTQLATLADHEQQLQEEIDRRRLALVEADRKLRLLEKLKERHSEEHQTKLNREETKIMDEIGSILHVPPNE